ncbi:flavodoxin family protein [Deltaproteobacteria bacterium OttesenSCG-928-M10]|nr:flavodoxin family protein [Deltaproteobacteria bacterium OttesenSCG-928-M10]
MKVLLINGSSKTKGNTALALDTAAMVFADNKIETDRIDIGKAAIHGCVGCGACFQKQNRRCVQFTDDPVNEWLEKILTADGLMIGSPVYYAGINGALKALLDRAFFVAAGNGGLMRHKVGAAVTAVRRAGSLPALEQIHKYFSISEMFMPSGNYWPQVFGLAPGEGAGDDEGLQCVGVLAANMAWLMKLMDYGREALPPPAAQNKVKTNFIRNRP